MQNNDTYDFVETFYLVILNKIKDIVNYVDDSMKKSNEMYPLAQKHLKNIKEQLESDVQKYTDAYNYYSTILAGNILPYQFKSDDTNNCDDDDEDDEETINDDSDYDGLETIFDDDQTADIITNIEQAISEIENKVLKSKDSTRILRWFNKENIEWKLENGTYLKPDLADVKNVISQLLYKSRYAIVANVLRGTLILTAISQSFGISTAVRINLNRSTLKVKYKYHISISDIKPTVQDGRKFYMSIMSKED